MHDFSQDGEYQGVIGRIEGSSFARTVLPTRLGPMSAVVFVPFAPHGLAVPWGSVVAVGDGSRPEIRVVDRQGRHRLLIRWVAERIPVTNALIEPLVDEAVSRATAAGDASYERQTREAFSGYPYPDTARSYSRLRVGRDGLLWVQQLSASSAGVATWLAFSPSGALVAAMDVPHGMRILDLGDDYALVRVTDDLGVESVALYELVEEVLDHER